MVGGCRLCASLFVFGLEVGSGVKVAVPWRSPFMSSGLSLLRVRWRVHLVAGRVREVKRVVRMVGVSWGRILGAVGLVAGGGWVIVLFACLGFAVVLW